MRNKQEQQVCPRASSPHMTRVWPIISAGLTTVELQHLKFERDLEKFDVLRIFSKQSSSYQGKNNQTF